jgi:coatomer subunit alpha
MMKVAQARNDAASILHNALYLGDVEVQVALLVKAGQPQLAYLMAKTHGFEEVASSILAEAKRSPEAVRTLPHRAALLKPPTPLLKGMGAWPLKATPTRMFESFITTAKPVAPPAAASSHVMPSTASVDMAGGWNDDGADVGAAFVDAPAGADFGDGDGAGWDLDAADELAELEHLDINGSGTAAGAVSRDDAPLSPTAQGRFLLPLAGPSSGDLGMRASSFAYDHASAGSFSTALQLLTRQVGLVNYEPLKPYLMTAYHGSRAWLSVLEGTSPVPVALLRSADADRRNIAPQVAFSFTALARKMEEAYAMTTAGRFTEAVQAFRAVLLSTLLTHAPGGEELARAQDLINSAREYIVGLSMEVHRRELNAETDVGRMAELAAYFTVCTMQPAHLMLSLRSAMINSFKIRNFSHANHFAMRLLDLQPPAPIAQQAQKIVAHYERNRTDALPINFDQFTPFVVCAASYLPIYRQSPMVRCGYCGAPHSAPYEGAVCCVCQVGQVGVSGTGLYLGGDQQSF